MSDPPPFSGFFFDNNLSPGLAEGLRAFDERNVVHLRESFDAGAKDEEWLPYIGRNGLILVTWDSGISFSPTQLAIVRDHQVGGFVFRGRDNSRGTIVQALIRHWPRLKRIATTERRPFLFTIPTGGGKMTSLLRIRPR